MMGRREGPSNGELFLCRRALRSLFNNAQDLFHDLRVQNRPSMKRDNDPELRFPVNAMASFGAKMHETGEKKSTFSISSGPARDFRHSPRRRW